MLFWWAFFGAQNTHAVPSRFCGAAYCCAVKPSPLLEGSEETCIQNVLLRLPSAVPLSQERGGGGEFVDIKRVDHMSQRTHARCNTFLKNNLSACSAITDYVADSDARWTQPLLKLLWTFNTSQRAAARTFTTTGCCTQATRHTINYIRTHGADILKKETSTSWWRQTEVVQLYERPGWSAVLHSLGYYTHFWDQPFHFTRYSQRPCKT